MEKVQPFQDAVVRLITGTRWKLEVVARTGSTNSDLAARARCGQCPDFTALVALDQGTGKGRLTRTWTTPPGTAVAMSVALPLAGEHWGLVPIAMGVAVVRALADCGIDATLKWPNDVYIGEKKVCGVLGEIAESTIVIGAGINILQTSENIGFDTGISVVMAGSRATREEVTARVLIHLEETVDLLQSDPHALIEAYRSVSATVGKNVRIYHDEITYIDGHAIDIAEDGQLLVDVDGNIRPFASGDVYHLR